MSYDCLWLQIILINTALHTYDSPPDMVSSQDSSLA